MALPAMQKPDGDTMRIPLAEGLFLEITPEGKSCVNEISDFYAEEYGEARFQLFEGHTYEYELIGETAKRYTLRANGVVIPSKRNASRGRICPNIYVGRLMIDLILIESGDSPYSFPLEVIATKFDQKADKSYRENYRKMLEDITDKCTDLMMLVNTPVTQKVETDYEQDSRTTYQRFCFVKSFLEIADFEEAILRIIANPSNTWNTTEVIRKTSQIRRVNRSVVRQLSSGSQREDTSGLVHLIATGLSSVPSHILSVINEESTDTAENRFIKHVLHAFLNFIEECRAIFSKDKKFGYAAMEAKRLSEKVNAHLAHPFFHAISPASSLKLNSPLLQKRSGYREVLNRWLQFDLASRLIWQGGEDVYDAGKRDIATLYEYWIFFQLYDLVVEKFNLEHNKSENFNRLFKEDESGLSLRLKSGKELIIKGETDFVSRNLSVRFSYNRTFKGGSKYSDKKAGSITTTLCPDYTLSIWPSSFNETEAEQQDVIVHIHFDAKYKIQNIQDQYTETENREEMDAIETEERKGNFKNVDILKMHAYKDAIRRTGGAYILYPGSIAKRFDGFHEVLPGLGAFTINPSPNNKTGISGLSDFLDKVIQHLVNRTSQRERMVNSSSIIINEPAAEYLTQFRRLPHALEKAKTDLTQTYVIVGYVKSAEHLNWCEKNGIYNFRVDDATHTLLAQRKFVAAKYLLLREFGKSEATLLYSIKSTSQQIWSKERLRHQGYPSEPSQDHYFIVEIEPCHDWENLSVPFKDFEEYQVITGSTHKRLGIPFVVTLDKVLRGS